MHITPFLWFNTEAEQAATYYVSIFPNSRIVATTHYGDAGPGPNGSVMTATGPGCRLAAKKVRAAG